MSRVLVISPHPDDESIGCGGTLLRHVAQGDEVEVIFLTSGEKGGHGLTEAETARVREGEARKAAAILGIGSVDFWHLPDGAVEADGASTARLAARLRQRVPSRIYVTHEHEMHPDHRAAAQIVRAAVSDLSHENAVPIEVLMYEIWTPTQSLDEIVDITPFIETKCRAIRAHRSQCAVVDFVAAARGLNRYRGEMHCWPEGDYAEVFARM